MDKQLNVRVSEELHKALKVIAAQHNITLAALVEKVLAQLVIEKQKYT